MAEEHEHYPESAYQWEEVEETQRTKMDIYILEAPIVAVKASAYSLLATLIDSWEPYDNPDQARDVFDLCECLMSLAPDKDRREILEAVKQTAGILGVWR